MRFFVVSCDAAMSGFDKLTLINSSWPMRLVTAVATLLRRALDW